MGPVLYAAQCNGTLQFTLHCMLEPTYGCWTPFVRYHNLNFTMDQVWLMRNAIAYCVEGFVSRHLMPEYEVGKYTGRAPWHPHLAVHQHLAWEERSHRQKSAFFKGNSPPSARASSMNWATSGKCREMFCCGTSSSFKPLYLMSKGE